MAAASLAVRVSAQIAEFQKSFKDASKTLDQFASDFEGTATKAATIGAFFGTIGANIATSLARGLGSALSDAVKFSSQFNNAFIGLASVARAFGTDTDLATTAAKKLSADGLLPLKDSATGLKNLLASGYGLPQATKLMEAFKDMAAFGRQGALSFGDAIRSGSEGIKNGNSILADNMGLTKNLSQILKEAGFAASDLSRVQTDAGVSLALYNGILKEAAAFTGDANRLTQTYQGTLDGMRTSWTNLLATWGDAITQNKTVAESLGFVRDAFTKLNGFLSDNRRGFLFVSDAIILFVQALAGTVRAINAVQGAFNALDTIVVGVTRGFLQSVKDIADGLIQLVIIASKLPGSSIALAGMVDEIRTLGALSVTSANGIERLHERMGENDRRAKSWGATFDGVADKLDGFAQHLKDTRGQTVQLGTAGDATGRNLNQGLGDGAAKAGAKVRALKDELLKLQELSRVKFDPLQGLGTNLQGGTLANQIPHIQRSSLLKDLQLPTSIDLSKQIVETAAGAKASTEAARVWVSPFRDAFTQLGQDLPGIIFGALQGGGSVVGSIAAGIGAQFSRTFQKATERIAENTAKGIKDSLTGSERAMGVASAGISAAFQGYALGQALGKKKGALAGAASGAAIGTSILPGWGTAIGAGVGALAGLFGGRSADKQAKAELVQLQAAAIKTAGGFAALKKQADDLGVSIGNALTTKNPKEFQAAMERLNTAIENQKTRWEGLQIAVEGVNKKADLFASPFRALIESRTEADANLDAISKKLTETAQRGQAEFERLGTFVGATFAGLVKESGDVFGAITALGPAFKVLQQGVTDFGLTSSGTIDQLLTMFGLVTNATTGPILQAIQATGQIFTGLQQAGFMTSELFQTVATDIGASFRDLEAKGGDVASAMALSQPVLQKLWEAQQIYGDITDETTDKILKQAEEQGLVGFHMKDVNQKILDVLLAIADVFGAKLPEAFGKTSKAAQGTASDVQDAFGKVTIPDWHIKVKFDVDELNLDGVPQLAHGGIVRRPTLALIGEAGPEAVVPLSQMGSGGSQTFVFQTYLDGRLVAENQARHLPDVLKRHGLV